MLGFIVGLKMLLYCNRVRAVVGFMTDAASEYHKLQQASCDPKVNFHGITAMRRFRYEFLVFINCLSCIGTVALPIKTVFLFVDITSDLKFENELYKDKIALSVLYSLLMGTAIILLAANFYTSFVLQLLLKAFPKRLYPVFIDFGRKSTTPNVTLYK